MQNRNVVQIARWTIWALLYLLALWTFRCAVFYFVNRERGWLYSGPFPELHYFGAPDDKTGWIMIFLSCTCVIAANFWLWLLRPRRTAM